MILAAWWRTISAYCASFWRRECGENVDAPLDVEKIFYAEYFRCLVNRKRVVEMMDNTYAEGALGLVVQSGTVEFSDFVAERLR
jgi:hypothetical protein